MRPTGEFEEFYAREHPRVLGLLCAVSGDRQTALDAADEAFVRALERWPRVARMKSPGGWTYSVALNALRRVKRRRAIEARLWRREPVVTIVPTTHPEVWEAVRALSPRQCEAIALRYVVDLPEAEIAAVMHISRGTVASTLADARVRLADLLAEPVFTEDAP
jgi:RNA polymerase sigma-70 factor (ECF subfamily)